MKTLLRFSLLFLALVSLAVPAEVTYTVKAKILEITSEGASPRPNPRFEIKFKVYVKNMGKSAINIPTAGPRNYSEAGKSYLISYAQWGFSQAPDGSRVVPPESSLGLVHLLPNEVAEIAWTERIYSREELSHLTVKLIIEEDFGKRFELGFRTISTSEIQSDLVKVTERANGDWSYP